MVMASILSGNRMHYNSNFHGMVAISERFNCVHITCFAKVLLLFTILPLAMVVKEFGGKMWHALEMKQESKTVDLLDSRSAAALKWQELDVQLQVK